MQKISQMKKTLLSILLILVFFPVHSQLVVTTTETPSANAAETALAPTAVPELEAAAATEKLTYEDDKIVFQISSVGMSVLNYQSKNYFDRKNNPIALTSENKPVLAFVWGPDKKVVNFKLSQDKNVFKGTASIDGFVIGRIPGSGRRSLTCEGISHLPR